MDSVHNGMVMTNMAGAILLGILFGVKHVAYRFSAKRWLSDPVTSAFVLSVIAITGLLVAGNWLYGPVYVGATGVASFALLTGVEQKLIRKSGLPMPHIALRLAMNLLFTGVFLLMAYGMSAATEVKRMPPTEKSLARC